MKTFIFLTTDGTEFDGVGNEAANCQMLAVEQADDVLTAYNQFLKSGTNQGYDSCFAYELVSDDVISQFDLIAD